MRLRVSLLVAVLAVLVVPVTTRAQLPQLPPPPQLPPVPQVPVPTPSAPQLPPVPQVPVPTPAPAPAPVPQAPSLPSVPGTGGGGGGSSSSSSSSSSAPSSSASGSSSSSPSSSGGGSGGSGASASSASGGSAPRSRAARTSPPERRRAERHLRRTVARLTPCLDNLATDQRRVLVLRAGIGPAHPHSRRGVARILDVRVQRVRRLERRGLREARVLSREGACGTSSSSSSSSFTGAGIATAPPPGIDTGAPSAAGGEAAESVRTGSSGSTDTGRGDVRGESAELPRPVFPDGGGQGSDPGGVSLAIGIALILLALALGFATPHLRARLRSS